MSATLSLPQRPAGPTVTIIEPPTGWPAPAWRELWRARELLLFLVWRDVKVRYKQTVIGAAWAVVQPVTTMLVFSLVFGHFVRVPVGDTPYPVFVYAGLLPWLLFASAVSQAGQSLVNQSSLVTKVYFPRLLIPISGVGVSLVDFVISFGVYVGILALYDRTLTTAALAVPLLVLLAAVTAIGVGTLLAGLTIVYRDFRYVIPFLVQTWLYLTPVVYPLDVAPSGYRWLLYLNPMTGVVGGFRSALLDQPWDWVGLSVSVVVAVGLLILGVMTFGRHERRFADVA